MNEEDIGIEVGTTLDPTHITVRISVGTNTVTKQLCGSQARFMAELLNGAADIIDPQTARGHTVI